ncbi:MAG: CopD family protein [Pseudomonadota bacterium]
MNTIKIIHLLCVMGWMTGIFAAPRGLIFWKREYAERGSYGPAADLTFRIYRFSAGLGVIAVITGLWLAYLWGFPAWTWLKLALVTFLIAHYAYTGVLIKRAKAGIFEQSDKYLRIYNEVSVFGAIAVLAVVVIKPF